jgi:hypothetical protein
VFNWKDASNLSSTGRSAAVSVEAKIQRILLGVAFAALLVPAARAQDQNPQPAGQGQQGQQGQSDATSGTPDKKPDQHTMTKGEQKSVNKDNRSTTKDSKADNKSANKDNRSTSKDAKKDEKGESNIADRHAESKDKQKSTKTERKDLHAGQTDVNHDNRALSHSSAKTAQKEVSKDNRSQHVSQKAQREKPSS